ncbi:hypothetical protein UY3_05676 [Chelonia mydas]|uniref:Uncharacterized protein n=1 Tax=Chelonia mydas TaxID=8469 RepID=M7BN44_CHEMY|nr:hypothetical protein UY3_05676 [Chelonia mydas]
MAPMYPRCYCGSSSPHSRAGWKGNSSKVSSSPQDCARYKEGGFSSEYILRRMLSSLTTLMAVDRPVL